MAIRFTLSGGQSVKNNDIRIQKPLATEKTGLKQRVFNYISDITPRLKKMGKPAAVALSALPIGRAFKVGGIAGKLALRGIPKVIQRARTLAGMAPKSTWSDFAKGTGKLLGAAGLGYYATTGKFPEPSTRTAAAFIGGKLSPIGLVSGGVHGLAETGISKIKDITIDKNVNLPYTQSPEYIKQLSEMYKLPSEIKGFETPSFNISMPQSIPYFQMPQSIGSPSYTAPSISVSSPPSMMGELLPLLLVGGAFGLGGYALGRRRKKRKYKKRKR